MKKLMFAGAMALIAQAHAHDGGHGPKLADMGKYGGTVMPVIEAKDADKGPKAALVHKSELVRSEDGTVNLYLYDQSMKPLALDKFEKKVTAKIGPMKRNPKWKTETFTLEQKGNSYVGKMPAAKVKPFYIDLTVSEGKKKLLTAFENLD